MTADTFILLLFLGLPAILFVLATGRAVPVPLRGRGGDPVAVPARGARR